MNAVFFDLFPLSVFQDKIILSQDEKNKLIDYIFKTEEDTKKIKKISKDDAWLGDSKGHEFLLKNSIMQKLEKLISTKIRLYAEMLDINTSKLEFFYQRSWATYTENEQSINFHTHSQSNISFAYYLLKPKNSGGIIFEIFKLYILKNKLNQSRKTFLITLKFKNENKVTWV